MSRGLKQFTYGVGFLAFLGAIGFGAYMALFESAPTCFDNRQNGIELGVDCGGGCVPCGQKYARDIEVKEIVKFPSGDMRTVIIAYLENPNDDFGFKDVIYTIEVKDTNEQTMRTVSDHLFMYGRSEKIGRYVVATVDAPMEDIADVVMTFALPEVVPNEKFVEPNVNIKRSSTDVVGVRRVTEPSYIFTKDLAMKAMGDDVKKLEEFLYQKQFFMKLADGTFDLDTKLALTAYQKARAITPATGIFDAKTRAKINAEIDRVERVTVDPAGSVSVNGNIKNDDIDDAKKVVITALLYDMLGLQIGGSKTELDDMKGAEERIFKIVFPKTTEIDRVDPTRTRLFVDAIK